jgi:hypothetical protein
MRSSLGSTGHLATTKHRRSVCSPSQAAWSCPPLRNIADVPGPMEQLACHCGELLAPAFTVYAADPIHLAGKEVPAASAHALPLVRPAHVDVLRSHVIVLTTARNTLEDQLQLCVQVLIHTHPYIRRQIEQMPDVQRNGETTLSTT